MAGFRVGDILRYKQGCAAYEGFWGKRIRVLQAVQGDPRRAELLDTVDFGGRFLPEGHCYACGGAHNFEYATRHPVADMLE